MVEINVIFRLLLAFFLIAAVVLSTVDAIYPTNVLIALPDNNNNLVQVINTSSSSANSFVVANLACHTATINVVRLISSAWFASGGDDNLVIVWSMSTLSMYVKLTPHTGPVRAIEPLTSGYFASGADDARIIIWDSTNILNTINNSGAVTFLVYLSTGKLASGDTNQTVKVFDFSGSTGGTLQGGPLFITNPLITMTEVNNQLLVSDNQKNLYIIDEGSYEIVKTVTGFPENIQAMNVYTDTHFAYALANGAAYYFAIYDSSESSGSAVSPVLDSTLDTSNILCIDLCSMLSVIQGEGPNKFVTVDSQGALWSWEPKPNYNGFESMGTVLIKLTGLVNVTSVACLGVSTTSITTTTTVTTPTTTTTTKTSTTSSSTTTSTTRTTSYSTTTRTTSTTTTVALTVDVSDVHYVTAAITAGFAVTQCTSNCSNNGQCVLIN